MRARAVVAAVLAAVLAAGAAAGEEVREESPFMVGDRTYASYFHEPQDTPAERAVVGRYGTIPFDYPDAASCLEDGSAWPDVRSVPTLDWGALDDRMEVEVCLYRVLRHFDDVDSILAWLAEAGFELNPRAGGVDDYRQSPAMRGTSRERYVVLNLLWKPSDLGPKAVWDSIPLLWRSTLEGLMLTVDVEDGSRVRSIRVASWNKWRN